MSRSVQPVLHTDEAAKALQQIPLPKGFRFRRVYFDLDSTGDPASYAVFDVSPELGASPSEVSAVGEIRKQAKQILDELEPERIPYVRFENAA